MKAQGFTQNVKDNPELFKGAKESSDVLGNAQQYIENLSNTIKSHLKSIDGNLDPKQLEKVVLDKALEVQQSLQKQLKGQSINRSDYNRLNQLLSDSTQDLMDGISSGGGLSHLQDVKQGLYTQAKRAYNPLVKANAEETMLQDWARGLKETIENQADTLSPERAGVVKSANEKMSKIFCIRNAAESVVDAGKPNLSGEMALAGAGTLGAQAMGASGGMLAAIPLLKKLSTAEKFKYLMAARGEDLAILADKLGESPDMASRAIRNLVIAAMNEKRQKKGQE